MELNGLLLHSVLVSWMLPYVHTARARCVFVRVPMFCKCTVKKYATLSVQWLNCSAIHDNVEKRISLIPRRFQTQSCEISLYNLGRLSYFSWQIISSTVRLDERLWTAIFRSLHTCSLGIRYGLWLGPLKDSRRDVLKRLLRTLKSLCPTTVLSRRSTHSS